MSIERKGGEAVFEKVTQMAKDVLMRDGFHSPTLIAIGDISSHATQIGGTPTTHAERASMMKVIGYAFALEQSLGSLHQVIMVTEGWAATPNEEGEITTTPSKDPNRKEVLVISMLDLVEERTQIGIYDMRRDTDGKLTGLEKWEPVADGLEERAYLLEYFVEGYTKARASKRATNGKQTPR